MLLNYSHNSSSKSLYEADVTPLGLDSFYILSAVLLFDEKFKAKWTSVLLFSHNTISFPQASINYSV